MRSNKMLVGCSGLILLLAFTLNASAQQERKHYLHVPTTISSEAQTLLRSLPDPHMKPLVPGPSETRKWAVFQQTIEVDKIENQKRIVDLLKPKVRKLTFGGVPVLEIRPKGWKDNGKVLVFTHGGAYTLRSAASTLGQSAVTADATGLRVISVDYTLAPHAKWQEVTDQVIEVFIALQKQGYGTKDIAIIGYSAGGGLAAASVLKMRDKGMGLPAAVILCSPWVDVSGSGDTYATLKHAEPFFVYELHLKNSADAYANPVDQKHPYVSPVYGDYSKGFSPTLIQGGTKELLLSGFVRLYQAMDTAGIPVKLDIYEGMPHVFQTVPDLPESKVALRKIKTFLVRHLFGAN